MLRLSGRVYRASIDKLLMSKASKEKTFTREMRLSKYLLAYH
jgi:hypothetical protein